MKRVLLCHTVDAVGAARLPALLHAAGFHVEVLGARHLAVAQSRFVEHVHPAGGDVARTREILDALIASEPDRFHHILADEPLLWTFFDRPASPEVGRVLGVTAAPERFRRILDKIEFNVAAEQAGISVPPFRVLRDASLLQQERWGGEPVVVKEGRSFSGSGVKVIHSPGEWQQAVRSRFDGPVMLQRFITGRLGASAVLFRRGVPQCWYSYFLLRNWPTPMSPASCFELHKDPQIEPMLRQLGALTEFDGLCGIDWIREDETGKVWLIEMNARPTPGLYLGPSAGISFVEAVRAWSEDRELIQRPAAATGKVVCLWPQNLFPSIERHEPLQFLKSFRFAPWSDPALLLSQLRRVLTHYLPADFRNKARQMLRPQA